MVEVFDFGITIERHLVRARIANIGLSCLYVGNELRDTYDPDPMNLWGPYNLFEPGLFPLEWRTILCDSIIRAAGNQAQIEFQLRSGLSRVYYRIIVGGKVVKRWKHRRG